MSRLLVALVMLLISVLGVACGGGTDEANSAWCADARRLAETAHGLGQLSDTELVTPAQQLWEKLLDKPPESIASDVAQVRAAVNSPSVYFSPSAEEAAGRVNSYVKNTCDASYDMTVRPGFAKN